MSRTRRTSIPRNFFQRAPLRSPSGRESLAPNSFPQFAGLPRSWWKEFLLFSPRPDGLPLLFLPARALFPKFARSPDALGLWALRSPLRPLETVR